MGSGLSSSRRIRDRMTRSASGLLISPETMTVRDLSIRAKNIPSSTRGAPSGSTGLSCMFILSTTIRKFPANVTGLGSGRGSAKKKAGAFLPRPPVNLPSSNWYWRLWGGRLPKPAIVYIAFLECQRKSRAKRKKQRFYGQKMVIACVAFIAALRRSEPASRRGFLPLHDVRLSLTIRLRRFG